MRAAVTDSPRHAAVVERPDPTVGAHPTGGVVIAVGAVGLCGTDYHIWCGEYRASRLPLIQGHEIAATVVSTYVEVPGLVPGTPVALDPTRSCGQCFACRTGSTNACEHMSVLGVHRDGGLCELLSVDADRLYPTGDLSASEAVLVEPASIGLEAVRRAGGDAGELAVVFGAGTIGTFAVAGLAARGLSVACVEPKPWRRKAAEFAGASLALDPAEVRSKDMKGVLREWAGSEGPSVVVEATGSSAVLETAVDVVVNAGTVVAVGISDATLSMSMSTIPYKALDLRGSRNSRGGFADAVRFVGEHRQLAELLVTHRFPLDSMQDALLLLDGAANEEAPLGKVVVEP